MATEVLNTNIAALEPHNPTLATALRASAHQSKQSPVVLVKARGGGYSARLTTGDRPWLHSAYHPEREADRRVHTVPTAATLVCHGLGAGWIPRAYLREHRRSTVIVVEPSIAALRESLGVVDFHEPLESSRLVLVRDAQELRETLLRVHHPSIADGVARYALPGRGADPACTQIFHECASVISETLQEIAAELATLRRFGRSWLTHTVINSRRLASTSLAEGLNALPQILADIEAVGAAGPGLDRAIARGVVEPQRTLAVDTALPALRARGLIPSAVVSLDPQGWSILHLRDPLPSPSVLVADLGVAPAVLTSAHRLVLLASRHPLHQLLATQFPVLLRLNQGMQSVTELAVFLAPGTRTLQVYGADGAFPRGQTYARGTYHYGHHLQRQHRLAPLPGLFAAPLYRTARAHADADGNPVFTTPQMSEQHSALQACIATRGGRNGTAPGSLEFPSHDRAFQPTHAELRRFWNTHAASLTARAAALRVVGPRSTPEILADLQSDGRAHLPFHAARSRSARETSEREVAASLDEASQIITKIIETRRR